MKILVSEEQLKKIIDGEIDERSRSLANTRKKRLFSKVAMKYSPNRFKLQDKKMKRLVEEEEVDEVRTQNKEMFDRGAFHMIYQSKSNPNVLFKIGTESMVNSWLEIFRSRPDLFPIVKRVGTIDYKFPKAFNEIDPLTHEIINHNAGDIVKIKYVEIEKLDVNRAEIHWDRLDDYLRGLTGKPLQTFLTHISIEDPLENEFIEIGNKLKENGNKFLYDIFRDFYNLLIQVYELKPTSDVHRRNFGYNEDMKLKMLDI